MWWVLHDPYHILLGGNPSGSFCVMQLTKTTKHRWQHDLMRGGTYRVIFITTKLTIVSFLHRGTRSCAHSATPSPHPETCGVSTCKEHPCPPPAPRHPSNPFCHFGFHHPPCWTPFIFSLSHGLDRRSKPHQRVSRDTRLCWMETGLHKWLSSTHWLSGCMATHSKNENLDLFPLPD